MYIYIYIYISVVILFKLTAQTFQASKRGRAQGPLAVKTNHLEVFFGHSVAFCWNVR